MRSHRREGLAAALAGLGLLAYAAMHSPLRGTIADAVGASSRGCYICPGNVSGADLAHAGAAAVLLVAACCAAAVTALRADIRRYERPLIFGVALAGFATVPAAIVGGLASLTGGHFLRPPAGPLLAAVPALVVTAAALRSRTRRPRPAMQWSRPAPLVLTVAGCAAAALGASVVVSLLHPPTQGDALTYHAPLSVFFWTDGNITSALDRSREVWAFAHPGTAELWYGLLRLLGGERLADLGQLPFALLGAAAVYAFTRRTGLGPRGAGLAAAAFLTVPMVVLQVGTQANDLAAAAFLMTAIALAAAPRAEGGTARAAGVGAALGLTAVTKLALLPGVAVVAIIAAVSTLRGGERRRLIVGLGTLLLVVAPWWIRNIVREGNPIFPQSLPLLGGGVNVGDLGHFDTEYVPNRAAWPLYSLFEPIDDRSGFGPLFVLALVPGLAALSTRGRRRPAVLLAAAFVLSLPFWWKYTLHEPRFLLAYVGLAAALVPWAIAAAGRWARVVGALVAAAAVLALVLVFDQAIIPSARLPVERARFYDRVYGVDPAVSSLPERVPLLQVTGYGLGRVEYAALYPLLGPSQRRRVLQLDSGLIRGSTRLVVARMRRAGVRYAYVTALARNRAAVERLFAPSSFTLIHRSGLAQRGRLGARRHVFGPVAPASPSAIVTRYLFAVHVRQPA